MNLSNLKAPFFVAFFCYFLTIVHATEVKIKQGKLKGAVATSRNGTKFFAFLNIPYAKPPVGELRFKSPQEPESWDDVRDATITPPKCVQKLLDFLKISGTSSNFTTPSIYGQEDCLYLNVYTPTITEKANLPVMVWIHGGGFVMGDGSMTQPDYLLDSPIVLVTINYRLGPLGFLSTADEILPGNYGMKDQVAALKWVKQNIEAFGGNPEAVTIFGESAGGASVHLLMHSPLSKGLFQRVIAQSGSALAPWAQIPPDVIRERAHTFGVLSGCPTKSSQELAECLRDIPAYEFTEIHDKCLIFDFTPITMFPPVIEPKTVPDAFLLENPWKQDEVISDIPLVIGLTSAEGAVFMKQYFSENGKMVTAVNKYYKRYFPIILEYGNHLPRKNCTEITDALKEFYFGTKEIGENTVNQLEKLLSDSYFAFNIMEAARRHKGKTYVYVYDHENTGSFKHIFAQQFENLVSGIPHADDLISLFPSVFSLASATTGPDLEVSQRMVQYWANFAKTGNPNGETTNTWEPLKTDEFEYLHIATKEDNMKTRLFDDRYKFWQKLQVQPQYSAKDFYNS